MKIFQPTDIGAGGGSVTTINVDNPILSSPDPITTTGTLSLSYDTTLFVTGAGKLSVVGGNQDAVTSVMATTGILPGAPVYNNGAAGVGATLTRSSNGTLGLIDGITAIVGDTVLVKNQVDLKTNGLYIVTAVGLAGGGGSPYIITRATSSDTTAELDGQDTIVNQGTTNAGSIWQQATNDPIIGTDNIIYLALPTGGNFIKQQNSGTQTAGNILWYISTAKTASRGTTDFNFLNATKKFTVASAGKFTLLVDPSTSFYGIGDISGILNLTSIEIDDFAKDIAINCIGTTEIGDTGLVGNGTVLTINDTTATTTIFTSIGQMGIIGSGGTSIYSEVKSSTAEFNWIFSTGGVSNVTPFTMTKGVLSLKPFATAAGNTSEIHFLELAANGTNYVGFKASDSLAGNVIWKLPTTDSTGQQALVSNGSGVMSFASIPISGSFSQAVITVATFTVTIGTTQANTSYKVNVTPTSALSAALFYVTNKTTTTFDVVFLAALTGTVTFDWSLFA